MRFASHLVADHEASYSAVMVSRLGHVRVVSLLALLSLAAPLGGCASAPKNQLHQVAGSTFSVTAPPPRGPIPVVPRAARPADPRGRFDAWLAAAAEVARAQKVPGFAVAVARDGEIVFRGEFGVVRAGSEESVTPHTRFALASLAKTVTAATAMSLVEHGGLALGSRLADVIPELRKSRGPDVTALRLSHALAHTAGIPDMPPFVCKDGGTKDLGAYFAASTEAPLLFEAGEVWDYSNGNYAAVALLVERTAQKPFAEVARERVLGPNGMADAMYRLGPEPRNVAWGHDASGAATWEPAAYDCPPFDGPGGLFASAEDVARLGIMLTEKRGALAPASVDAMMAPHARMHDHPAQHYGFGTYTTEMKGEHLVLHGGSLPGTSTILATVPDKHLVVAVLANAQSSFANDAARGALETLLDLPEGPDPSWLTEPSSWPRYVGAYRDPYGKLGDIEVTLEGGRLFLTLHGDRPEPLPSTLTGEFVPGPEGRVDFFVTRLGVARRQTPAARGPGVSR